MKIFQIFFCFVSLVSVTFSIKMIKLLEFEERFCFEDDIPHHTLVKLYTQVQYPAKLQIKSHYRILKEQDIAGENTLSWTTPHYGLFEFCFSNVYQPLVTVRFQFLVGQRAKDFQSSYGGSDYMRSLQSQAYLAERFIDEVERQNSEGLQIVMSGSLQPSQLAGVHTLSVIFVTVSILLVILQYRMVKKHLHNRKYL